MKLIDISGIAGRILIMPVYATDPADKLSTSATLPRLPLVLNKISPSFSLK